MDYKALVKVGNDQWKEAYRLADPQLFSELFDEEGQILVSGGKYIKGRIEIEHSIRNFMSMTGPIDVHIDQLDVWALDDGLVYENGRFTYNNIATGEVLNRGVYVVIWKVQADGSLKIYRDIGTDLM